MKLKDEDNVRQKILNDFCIAEIAEIQRQTLSLLNPQIIKDKVLKERDRLREIKRQNNPQREKTKTLDKAEFYAPLLLN